MAAPPPGPQSRMRCRNGSPGSIGEAFDRYRRTPAWLEDKKPRTREEWEAAWARIAPVFGDSGADRSAKSRSKPWPNSAVPCWRLCRIRKPIGRSRSGERCGNVCTALNYCHGKADPSKGMRNAAPPPRNAVWRAGEVVRLAKAAWRWEYHGLAVAIAMAWDTPVLTGRPSATGCRRYCRRRPQAAFPHRSN